MALDALKKLDMFSGLNNGIGINEGGSRPITAGGGKAASGGSGLSMVDKFNSMDNKFEGGQPYDNGYAGQVRGQDNYVARKLDYLA